MFACPSHDQCIDQALKNAESICLKNKMSLTALRRKVLELVWFDHGPVKAYDILEKLGNRYRSAKPPTVYRSLKFLTQNGLVHKLNSLNAYVGCSHPSKHHQCYFLICSHCGEVRECCNKNLDRAISITTDKIQFKSSRITLEIEGECMGCQS